MIRTMNKRTIYYVLFSFIIIVLIYSFWSLYYILPVKEAKPQIQQFLNTRYKSQFQIVTIEKYYSRDLFKQPIGYRLTLMARNKTQFGNVFLQYNQYQKGWIPFAGTDIEKEYEKVKAD